MATSSMIPSLSRRAEVLVFWVIFSIITCSVSVEGLSLNKTPTSKIGRTVVNRRDWLKDTAVTVVSGGIVLPQVAKAGIGDASSSGPIAVLGASGRTGALCVAACLTRGIPVRALTRSGSWDFPPDAAVVADENVNKLLSVAACDVKDSQALSSALKGCRGVIYAASASKKGGNAKEIDNVGVVQGGDICLQESIPRYVVISSTATTRPNSLGFKFTNVFGGIMDEKRLGELGVQNAYKAATTGASYSIIRPGGLEEPKKNEVLGPSSLEISQGDVLSGIVSRADLAEVAVELALSGAPNLKNTAMELYYTNSAQPCEGKFKSMMTNGIAPRLHGNTYAKLFEGIEPGIDYYA